MQFWQGLAWLLTNQEKWPLANVFVSPALNWNSDRWPIRMNRAELRLLKDRISRALAKDSSWLTEALVAMVEDPTTRAAGLRQMYTLVWRVEALTRDLPRSDDEKEPGPIDAPPSNQSPALASRLSHVLAQLLDSERKP